MMNEIIQLCKERSPNIIYLAIGCARAPLQQYPPFIKEIGGTQVCILIDPILEETLTHERPANATFFSERRYFQWGSNEDTEFIHELCKLNVEVIVQDYSGTDTRSYYPIQALGPSILKRVLFDVTYSDGGCFVDFDTVNILRMEDGGFVNPQQQPLAACYPYIPTDLLKKIVVDRNIAVQFLNYFYGIEIGTEEARHWCTPQNMEWRAAWMFVAYGIPRTSLKELLIAYLIDLATTAGDSTMTPEYAATMIGKKDYIATTGFLTSLL